MAIKSLKYFVPLIVFLLAIMAFNGHGWACYGALLFAWVLVPLAELIFPPNPQNMSLAEEELAKKDPVYDFILYTIVLLQVSCLFYFLVRMHNDQLSTADTIGRIFTMGLLCGTFGINVGHELGHRVVPFEKWLAKISLMTSLYGHFYIEHNKGHHKRVATRDDPSTARYGEPVYTFWFRSMVNAYIGAWQIANKDQRKKGLPALHWQNEMLQVQVLQLALILTIFLLFGGIVLCYFLAAAGIGILLLETVNYIEHYGLARKQLANGQYERTQPHHSWNSDHVLGRLLLFELSRHSDHHYMASRKYQVLRHHDSAPQMPTGYPGMILLSLVPFAWFRVMHRRIAELPG
jgi:alkane 1-monooxygenase